jgi:hypothetical protein
VKPEEHLAKLQRASQRVRKAETTLASARAALYETIRAAQADGVSLSAMARELGVSRQSIQKIMARIGK